jgi:hypothetical protein
VTRSSHPDTWDVLHGRAVEPIGCDRSRRPFFFWLTACASSCEPRRGVRMGEVTELVSVHGGSPPESHDLPLGDLRRLI